MAKKRAISSITVSPETLALVNRVKGFRGYRANRYVTLDEVVGAVFGEELERIAARLKPVQEGK